GTGLLQRLAGARRRYGNRAEVGRTAVHREGRFERRGAEIDRLRNRGLVVVTAQRQDVTPDGEVLEDEVPRGVGLRLPARSDDANGHAGEWDAAAFVDDRSDDAA